MATMSMALIAGNWLALVAEAQTVLPIAATPEGLESTEPFAFADFSWIPGNTRTPSNPLRGGDAFTGEFRADIPYHYSFAAPKDHTMCRSSEVFHHGEVQLTQLGLGGVFQVGQVQGRVMTQFGMYAMTTPRNNGSPSRDQWDLANVHRDLSEAYAGNQIDAPKGVNVQAGIYNVSGWAPDLARSEDRITLAMMAKL